MGIKPVAEAQDLANSKGLDLVEIAPQANPPVCKIVDFNKFRYEQERKQRETKKKVKAGLLKEIRMRPHIATHDLEIKAKHIEEFLAQNEKVRITVVFRGRENRHKEVGVKLLEKVQERLVSTSAVEKPPQADGNRMSMTLIPKK